MDAVPEIHMPRQRIDDGMSNVRESAVRAAQEAARQAKDAAYAADRYAHDEPWRVAGAALAMGDRKSTRLNSSHQIISYAVFCLKKKKTNISPAIRGEPQLCNRTKVMLPPD